MTLYKKMSAVLFLITYLPCVGMEGEPTIEGEKKNYSSTNKENINPPPFLAKSDDQKEPEFNIGPSQRRIGYWYNALTPEQLKQIHTKPKNTHSFEIELPAGFETESETDSEETLNLKNSPSTPSQSKEAHTQ